MTSVSAGAVGLARLSGLGPTSAGWLAEAGIGSPEVLDLLGSVAAYRRVRDQRGGVSLNLLWALETAILDCHWRDLSPQRKAALRAELKRQDAE